MNYQIDDLSYNLLKDILLPKHSETGKKKPTVYAMAGIPGAGKTTFVEYMLKEGKFPQNAYVLSPDNVMELIPEYQRDCKLLGAKKAFKRWEMPARYTAYKLMEEAIKLRIDIIQDISNARRENYRKLKQLKEIHKYELEMHWLEVPIDVALDRIKSRQRFTPKFIVKKRFEALHRLKPLYKKLVADNFNSYDYMKTLVSLH